MTARPILFSAPMVKALLDGRKTQTRRVLKDVPVERNGYLCTARITFRDAEHFARIMPEVCPYGRSGDMLWVRESLCRNREPDERDDEGRGLWAARYAADRAQVSEHLALGMWCPLMALHGFRRPPRGFSVPSIHMPMAYSRLTLRITEVRVERLQSISETDAIAEGAERDHSVKWPNGDPGYMHDLRARNYANLWESINGKGSWDANPWVWVIAFDTVKQNVDAVTRAAA